MKRFRSELFGESVFTSFKVKNGKVQGLSMHLERLYQNFALCYGVTGLSFNEFKSRYFGDEVFKLIESASNHYFRLTLYSKEEADIRKISFNLDEFELDILIRPLGNNSDKVAKDLVLRPSPFGKGFVESKMGSYAQNLFYKRLAIREGHSDVLFYNEDDCILEVTTSNIVFLEGNTFIFMQASPIFHGITETLFKKFLKKRNIPFEERKLFVSEIGTQSQAYTLNSVEGIVPVSKIGKTNLCLNSNDIIIEFSNEFLESSYE